MKTQEQSKLFRHLSAINELENQYKKGEPIKKTLIRVKNLDATELLLFSSIKRGGDFGIITGQEMEFITYVYKSCDGAVEVKAFLDVNE